ncbi:hypothetical protein CYMTET_15902 [Cymbomonas tetramitiformis]|uniref:Cadherin-like beta-sandwich-like domain-containing protein n=1 Tax=Cymbomonas tetramitiformis TaxID=36881 RepID=A0AAE0L8Q2_9CHLO|nr:hypothetical protein CYMTET_15902 [Cymbomonas tetramitiformis]
MKGLPQVPWGAIVCLREEDVLSDPAGSTAYSATDVAFGLSVAYTERNVGLGPAANYTNRLVYDGEAAVNETFVDQLGAGAGRSWTHVWSAGAENVLNVLPDAKRHRLVLHLDVGQDVGEPEEGDNKPFVDMYFPPALVTDEVSGERVCPETRQGWWTPAEEDARLTSLSATPPGNAAEVYDVEPAFGDWMFNYVAEVPFEVERAVLIFTTASAAASAVVTPAEGAPDGAGVDLPFGGVANISVKVTSENGKASLEYTVTVKRAYRSLSANSLLDNATVLEAFTWQPSFNATVTQYTVLLPLNTTETVLRSFAQHPNARLALLPEDGSLPEETFDSGTPFLIPLSSAGLTRRTLRVFAENGIDTTDYVFTFARTPPPPPPVPPQPPCPLNPPPGPLPPPPLASIVLYTAVRMSEADVEALPADFASQFQATMARIAGDSVQAGDVTVLRLNAGSIVVESDTAFHMNDDAEAFALRLRCCIQKDFREEPYWLSYGIIELLKVAYGPGGSYDAGEEGSNDPAVSSTWILIMGFVLALCLALTVFAFYLGRRHSRHLALVQAELNEEKPPEDQMLLEGPEQHALLTYTEEAPTHTGRHRQLRSLIPGTGEFSAKVAPGPDSPIVQQETEASSRAIVPISDEPHSAPVTSAPGAPVQHPNPTPSLVGHPVTFSQQPSQISAGNMRDSPRSNAFLRVVRNTGEHIISGS